MFLRSSKSSVKELVNGTNPIDLDRIETYLQINQNAITMKNLLLLTIGLTLLTACGPSKYITNDYKEYSPQHRKIAVLPFSNHYTGRIPDNMTAEELLAHRVDESILFQASLYHQLLDESGIDDDQVQISIQDVGITNSKLEKNGISIEESWTYDPTELASILGVDALVKVNMYKDQMLSRTESALVDIASSVIIPRTTGNIIGQHLFKRSAKIELTARLIDGTEGIALWAIDRKCNLDWRKDPDDAVREINNTISKKFPYRKNL